MKKIITISKHSADVYKQTSYEATDNLTGKKIENYSCKTSIDYITNKKCCSPYHVYKKKDRSSD